MHDPRTIGATVKAVDGVVVIDGLGCMAVTMSPEIAAKVSDQLLYAAAEATGQLMIKRDEALTSQPATKASTAA